MIFLDNASTTKCLESSAQIVANALCQDFFNPSSLYTKAYELHKKLGSAKDRIRDLLNAENYNVIFTGSATEANNLAIFGMTKSGKNIISTMGEHPSIFEPLKKIKNNGTDVVLLDLDENGVVDIAEFEKNITINTALISIINVSNETGAINDIKRLVEIAKKKNPKVIFHSDGVQAFGKINVDLDELGVDLYTISSHKIYGPKGVGALLIKKGLNINPQILGGGQEDGIRSGTENLPGILGFCNSAEFAVDNLEENYNKIYNFKQNLINTILDKNKKYKLDLKINGDPKKSSPYILSLSIDKIKSEVLLHSLEKYEIYIGTGSACSSKKSGNRILDSMKLSKTLIEGNIRLSFGLNNLNDDINLISETILIEASKLNK